MLYNGNSVIFKIGNSNRMYFNGNVVYQGYSNKKTLPDVPFMFNYNAKNYSNGIITNTEGALFTEDMKLTGLSNVVPMGDYLEINGFSPYTYRFDSVDANPFNRSSNNSKLTIISKCSTPSGDFNIFANRSNSLCYDGDGKLWSAKGGTYNFMWRQGNVAGAYLHTQNAAYTALNVDCDLNKPNIIAVRCTDGDMGYIQNYTTGVIGETGSVGFGTNRGASRFQILGGSVDRENFLGEFYWLYVSLEELTDEQIQQVIDYNEGL